MKKYLALLIALTLTAPALAIDRNVSGQKVTVLAWDSATGRPKTGDSANITAYVQKDDGTVTVLGDTSASEKDATNAKGQYIFDLTQGETDAIKLTFSGKSSTSGIDVYALPAVEYTKPAGQSTLTIANNAQNANVAYWLGTAPLTPRVAGLVEIMPPAATWYIDDTEGSGDNGSFDAPFDSYTQLTGAVTLRAGDIVHWRAGTYDAVAIATSGIIYEGDGDATKITDASLSTGTINGSSLANVTIRNMWIDTTASSSNALRLSACRNTQIRGCKVTGGSLASIKCFGGTGLTISDCDVTSHADAIAVNGEQGFLVERCNASTDNATTSSGGAGLWAGNSAVGIARACRFSTSKAVSSSQLSMAVELDGPDDTTGSGYVLLEDCVLRANCLHPSASGRVACVGGILADSVIRAGLRNCTLSMSNLGSGTGYQIDARQAGSRIDLWQVEADRTTFNVVGTASGTGNTRTIVDHDLLQKGTTFDQLVVTSSGKVSPADDSITASTFDESTAFPLKSADTGSTQVARKGSEDVTLTDIEAGSGGGGTPAQVHNEKPVPAFTATLGTRADGVTRAYPVLKLTKTASAHIWIDCSKLLSDNIEDVTDGESDDEDVATVEDLGMYEKFVSIVLDTSGATVGDTVTITCEVEKIGPVAVDVVIKAP